MRTSPDDDSFDEDPDAEDHDDPEAPAEADQDPHDEDDDPQTVACPFCGRTLVEGADVCPRCGNFIAGSDDPATTRIHPRWVIVTAIVLLAAMALWATWWSR